MPVTLAQAKLTVQDDLYEQVIDEFRKSNFLIENMVFDDVVSPVGNGATMTYTYNRVIAQSLADFRVINEDYTPQEAEKERFSVDLKPFGGSFEVDRIINSMGGIVNEVTFQMKQKIKGASALFNETAINGDSSVNAKAFDGLDKAVSGSDTEIVPTSAIDFSTSAKIDTNYRAFLDILEEFLANLDDTPSFIGGNTRLVTKIKAIARRAGQYQETKDDFGRNIAMYGNIPIVDFGSKAGSNVAIVPTDAASGETSLYAARFGLDGFHAVSMAGNAPIRAWLPDYNNNADAVQKGAVEMVAAVVLKSTKAAGILRKIKIA